MIRRRFRRVLVFAVVFATGCAEAVPGSGLDLGAADAGADLARTDLLPGDGGGSDGGPDGGDGGAPGDLGTSGVCQGEKYDVNASTADGCEVTDAPLTNHTEATSVFVGSRSCDDGSSALNLMGLVPADNTTHTPPVTGFDASSGSAPDWFRIDATGGLCVNDLNLHLAVTGSTKPTCYKLSAKTSASTYTCQSGAAGTCDITNGAGSYVDGTNIFVFISKTCAGNDKATYVITGHL